MAGPAPKGVTAPLGTVQADYKGTEALKTCHSEFRHIPLMWTYRKGRWATIGLSFYPAAKSLRVSDPQGTEDLWPSD